MIKCAEQKRWISDCCVKKEELNVDTICNQFIILHPDEGVDRMVVSYDKKNAKLDFKLIQI